MTSVGILYCPDTESFFEAVVESLRDILSREELVRLLTEVLNRFVAEDNLSREEADALREYLNELNADLALSDRDMLLREQLSRKRFLKRFPRVKRKLEESIRKLHALADKVDKDHRDCTIYKVAATSAGAASGLLNILGLTLAPATSGVSLALLATGLGLGATAAVTSVATSVKEHKSVSLAENVACHLMSPSIKKWTVVKEILQQSRPRIVSSREKLTEAVQRIEMNIRAIKLVRANPGLLEEVMRFLTTGQISYQCSKQLQEVLKDTGLAMAKGARILAVASASSVLVMDVGYLVKEAMHLRQGAKAEFSEQLRQRARELESRLEELTRTYESLQ
ncbi:Apolipoprotein L3 [Camelus dromedarius]|uniref:Apolipoprotein L3 n=2 Tax=Camelus dromedarius TaxID=9838 RepID=A0A5N4DEN2_CAMDR|nr:apolipoprotein L3-like isoform X1 [Camelus dromedarius]XP_031319050.1 apolipoprotein L3-like isoform X1 [Camelus dromedarius]XP_031319051.1 apolipoprotein L3-like isoform X1 [Camelus dromedarius]KAB1269567.1 Apolipoprotein L3 [Camelus dromedarius]